MKSVQIGVLVVILALVGWFIGMPYYAAAQLEQAVNRGDSAAIADYVNFPAFRESLRATLNAQVMKEAGNAGQVGQALAVLGTMLTSSVVDHVIELAVTPEGVAQLMRGGLSNLGQNNAGNVNVRRNLEGLGRFVVHVSDSGGKGEIGLVFRPDGLVWKLSAIALP